MTATAALYSFDTLPHSIQMLFSQHTQALLRRQDGMGVGLEPTTTTIVEFELLVTIVEEDIFVGNGF